MLHLHDLHHVQVGLRGGLVDGQDGIDDVGGQFLGQGGVELGGQGSTSDGEEKFPVDLLGQLEGIEEFQGLVLGDFKAFGDDTRM